MSNKETPARLAAKAGLKTFQEACNYLNIPRKTLERLCERDPRRFECLMIGVSTKIKAEK